MTSSVLEEPPVTTAARTAGTPRILVVDDENTIRMVLAKYLRTRGFDVSTAESGDAALEQLAERKFDLMLCDVRMPGLSGVELVPSALEIDPALGIVMLSAVNDASTATESMAQGVLDYLTKPIELPDLYDAVQRALRKKTATAAKPTRVDRVITDQVGERTRQLEQERDHYRDLAVSVIETIVNTMEGKDLNQRGHSARVGELSASVAEYMELSPEVVEDIRIAGRLHDVGNVGIRVDVLNKPGPLNPDEIAHVREHVRIGVDLLSQLQHIERAVLFIGDHHEHWDGTGYPHARVGDQISIGGRIIAVTSAYDALTSRRSYREPMPMDDALDELRKGLGTQFDPNVVQALRAVVKKRRTLVFQDPARG
jgi:putative two-component system response regulator